MKEITSLQIVLQGFIYWENTIAESNWCEKLPPCKSYSDEYAVESCFDMQLWVPFELEVELRPFDTVWG